MAAGDQPRDLVNTHPKSPERRMWERRGEDGYPQRLSTRRRGEAWPRLREFI